MNFPMEIGHRLHQLRVAKGLSQGGIEKRTGLLRCYVSRVECGHTVPNLDTLRKWAAALEVEMYQLFFEGEGKPQASAPNSSEKIDLGARGLVESFNKLDAKDKKFVLATARKMATGKRTAKQAT